MEPLCDICENIDFDLIFEPRNPEVAEPSFDLGSYESICSRATSCSFCKAIVAYVNKHHSTEIGSIPRGKPCYFRSIPRWSQYFADCGYHIGYIEHMREKLRSNEIELPQSGQDEARLNLHVGHFRICRIYDDDLPIRSQWLRERRVTATKLDVSLFKTWLQTCCTKHGKHCENPTWLSPKVPKNLRVIDIRTRSVINAPLDCRYAALSYVWGGPQFVINDAQMRNLPFCLPEPPVLSQTLVDAIALCGQIGIDYLWVDALCITQEPPVNDDKSFQLQQMDRIYRSAFLTICAASSESAKHGIHELRARPSFHNIISFKGKSYAVIEASLENDVDLTLWNWRGWTYQERVLSRRLLIITQKQTYWICQCDTWTESTVSEPVDERMKHQMISNDGILSPPQRNYSFGQTVMVEGASGFDSQDLLFATYEALMQEYTRRSLGHPQDGLNAIQGILNLITESGPCHGTRFVHGLPLERFDLALLWKSFTHLGRGSSTPQNGKIPTWSWASWFTDNGPGAYYDMSDFFSYPIIEGAVTWYILNKDGTSSLLSAKSSESARDVCGLPTGLDPFAPPKLPSAHIHQNNFYLHFLSTVATFRIGEQLPWDTLRPTTESFPRPWQPFVQHWTANHTYELLDRNSLCIGHIILPDAEIEHSIIDDDACEFVFLSYANAFDAMVHEKSRASLNDLRPECHKYNIVSCMMIRRDKTTGFASRAAVGKVLQSAWEAAVSKAEWVLLG